jgi:hypothetical protein
MNIFILFFENKYNIIKNSNRNSNFNFIEYIILLSIYFISNLPINWYNSIKFTLKLDQ